MLKRLKTRLIKVKNQVFDRIDQAASKNYFTNVYGLARSLLATGTLITLIFNSKYVLFPKHILKHYKEYEHRMLSDYNLFYLFDYDNLIYAQLLGIFILIIVCSGYYPRITGILHWWVSYSYFTATGLPEGGDQVTAILTLCLIPITLLDSRKNHWYSYASTNNYKNFIAFLFFLLIQIQMAIIYLHASIEKFYKSELWVDGTAIYYWFNDNIFGMNNFLKFFVNPLLDVPVVLSLTTWGVLIFELFLFGAFFMSASNKRKMFVFGILFHFSIILFHGLVSFFFAMAGGLVLFLLQKNETIYFFHKLKKYAGYSRKATV